MPARSGRKISYASALARLAARGTDRDVLRAEPQRSFYRPPALHTLLAGYGFTLRQDRDVIQTARELHAPTDHLGPFVRANRIAVTDNSR
jgi:hypothetical protein